MAYNMNFGQAFKMVDASGTVTWLGAAITPGAIMVKSAEASATAAAGEAIRLDTAITSASTVNTAALTLIPRYDYQSNGSDLAEGLLSGLRVSNAANVGWIGVASEAIPFGKTGKVYPTGTITCVKCLALASQTDTTGHVGNAVFGSATAGSVDSTQTRPTLCGSGLGFVLQISGTTAGYTGSATQLGILIQQT